MANRRNSTLLARVREGRGADTARDIAARRSLIVQGMQRSTWDFLTAKDYDGRPLIWTKDEKGEAGEKIKPYPTDKPYLHALCDAVDDPLNFILICEKTRQLMFSYTVLLALYRRAIFGQGENVFILRGKKDSSVKIINDKIRDTHRNCPAWFRAEFPISDEPKNVIHAENTGSIIQAASKSLATAESRGDSGTVFADEAAYETNLPDIHTAAIAMARQIIYQSTPKRLGAGSETMQRMIRKVRDNAVEVLHPCEGVTITRASAPETRGKFMTLLSADIQTEEQRTKSFFYLTEASRRGEQSLSWQGGDGQAYFPEFTTNGGESYYTMEVQGYNPNLPIDRGFDFGVTRPACTWSQTDPDSLKITLLRAHIGSHIDPWSYARLIRFLSGEITREELGKYRTPDGYCAAEAALKEIMDGTRDGLFPTVPWFQGVRPNQFRNWGGNEVFHTTTGGPGQKNEQYVEIFAAEGIRLSVAGGPKERREYITRGVLMPREDGSPGFTADRLGGRLLVEALSFGLTRPPKTLARDTEEPMDDKFYKNIYDAFGYTLVGTLNHVDWTLVKRGVPGPVRDASSVEDYEHLRRYGAPRWGEDEEPVGAGGMFEAMMATRW